MEFNHLRKKIDHEKEETGRKNYGKTTMRHGWSIFAKLMTIWKTAAAAASMTAQNEIKHCCC